MSLASRLLALGAIIAFALMSGVQPGRAQSRYKTLGPNECVNCHDHQAERQWWERQEIPEVQKLFPKMGANAGHINALKQLEMPKSNDFAKAVGLRDKYDVNGSCVKCHATVFAGDANAGVSCESCHGAGEGYLKVHQTKGAYDQAVAAGQTNLVGQLDAWARQCTSCHVMDDKRLVDAGHPSGDDFDLGQKYAPVALHFKKKYEAARVSAVGRPQVQALVAKRGGGTVAAAPPVAPPPAPPPAPTPSPAPTPPPVTTTAAAPPTPAPTPLVAVPPRPAPAPTTPAATTPAAPTPAAPLQPPPAVTSAPLPYSPPSVAPATAVVLPASLPAAVALVQGRLVAALTDLLQRGAAAPVRTSTPAPAVAPYAGPDAQLLQLQREAIALALEALGTAPSAPPAAAPASQP